jgi:hypothetical protein
VTARNTLLGTAGRLDAGDTIAVKFSGPIDPKTVCSSWSTGASSATAATVWVDSTGSILDASDIALTGYSFTTPSGVQF